MFLKMKLYKINVLVDTIMFIGFVTFAIIFSMTNAEVNYALIFFTAIFVITIGPSLYDDLRSPYSTLRRGTKISEYFKDSSVYLCFLMLMVIFFTVVFLVFFNF
jgi:hypothetical protein